VWTHLFLCIETYLAAGGLALPRLRGPLSCGALHLSAARARALGARAGNKNETIPTTTTTLLSDD